MDFDAHDRVRSLARLQQSQDACVVLEVVADLGEAAHVRHAIAHCECAGVLRCTPLLSSGRVRLQLRCPATQLRPLMRQVMAGALAAEFGRVVSWETHLAQYQALRHG